jgi:hypothetical protein
MNTHWLAIDAKADPRTLAQRLAQVHDRVLSGDAGQTDRGRDVIEASWKRCQAQGVEVDGTLADPADSDQALARWKDGHLASAVLSVGKLMGGVGQASEQVLLFCDTEGTLVWLDAVPTLIQKALSVNLEPGSNWSERAAGTNAMGTALAAGHPLQVFGPEHYVRSVHDWACSAAPVRDPETAQTLGVVDLSGPVKNASALSLGVAIAAASLIEQQLSQYAIQDAESLSRRFGGRVGMGAGHPFALANQAGRLVSAANPGLVGARAEISMATEQAVLPSGERLRVEPLVDQRGFLLWLSGPASGGPITELRFEALGRTRSLLHVNGLQHELPPRQSEVLTLLALRPSGWTANQLANELFGESGNPVSVRALMSRLRSILGDQLQGQPYRLVDPPKSDFALLERHLQAGRIREAVELLGRGELLPESESSIIAEARLRMTMSVREVVVSSADPTLLSLWISFPAGEDDAQACRLLMRAVHSSDPRYSMAAARLRRISGV